MSRNVRLSTDDEQAKLNISDEHMSPSKIGQIIYLISKHPISIRAEMVHASATSLPRIAELDAWQTMKSLLICS